jgi:hypothetical protein
VGPSCQLLLELCVHRSGGLERNRLAICAEKHTVRILLYGILRTRRRARDRTLAPHLTSAAVSDPTRRLPDANRGRAGAAAIDSGSLSATLFPVGWFVPGDGYVCTKSYDK